MKTITTRRNPSAVAVIAVAAGVTIAASVAVAAVVMYRLMQK